ncbi:CDP-alcohol phosphatidyltransferase family protein [Candidatus Bathyarchaeota archaeon]|nr:MAG: CDP-alcohol phosphatidyltransferase family protein [Candidatus Bathyarchaeota archaeon]
MLTRIKREIQFLLSREAEILHKAGFTPNIISVTGLIFAFISAVAYATWKSYHPVTLLLAAVLLLISGFCDAIDGVIARLYKQATAFGGFLDSLLDRYSDAFIIAGIIIGGLCELFWGFLALIGSLLVSYSRARAEAAGIKMESVGIAERAERILIISIFTVIAVFYEPQTILNIGVIVLALLTNFTVIQRLLYFYKACKIK